MTLFQFRGTNVTLVPNPIWVCAPLVFYLAALWINRQMRDHGYRKLCLGLLDYVGWTMSQLLEELTGSNGGMMAISIIIAAVFIFLGTCLSVYCSIRNIEFIWTRNLSKEERRLRRDEIRRELHRRIPFWKTVVVSFFFLLLLFGAMTILVRGV